jgi:hypothetical protein
VGAPEGADDVPSMQAIDAGTAPRPCKRSTRADDVPPPQAIDADDVPPTQAIDAGDDAPPTQAIDADDVPPTQAIDAGDDVPSMQAIDACATSWPLIAARWLVPRRHRLLGQRLQFAPMPTWCIKPACFMRWMTVIRSWY